MKLGIPHIIYSAMSVVGKPSLSIWKFVRAPIHGYGIPARGFGKCFGYIDAGTCGQIS